MPDDPNRRSPRIQRSTAPRRPAVEAIYKGRWMRSLLEVEFAKQLDARGIAWDYEPERLRGGRYLVDFHLPALKAWVEVKGRFEARDHLLLPLVAAHLEGQRGERLFLLMRSEAYRITVKGFARLSLEAFWQALQELPPGDDLRYLRERKGE